jgi:hypothetical protein
MGILRMLDFIVAFLPGGRPRCCAAAADDVNTEVKRVEVSGRVCPGMLEGAREREERRDGLR